MPFPTTTTRIQPLDPDRPAPTKPPAPKSRLKRLFERQFPGVVKNPPPPVVPATAAEKIAAAAAALAAAAAAAAAASAAPVATANEAPEPPPPPPLEPSSVCLGRMVQSFLEDGANDEKHQPSGRCGRTRCHCFNGSCDDSSDEEDLEIFVVDDVPPATAVQANRAVASEVLKSLVACGSSAEKDILSETARIMERNIRTKGGKEDCTTIRKMVADGLTALGYDASTCKCRWEKTQTIPAGEYEFVDVILSQDSNNSGSCSGGGSIIATPDRVVIDIDFRSEFQIARPNKSYRAVLQALPPVFVGRPERLQQIIALVAEEARQSLRKKGLHVPPWRRYEYLKSKWLSPSPIRATAAAGADAENKETPPTVFPLASLAPLSAAAEPVLVDSKKPGELDLRLDKSGKLPAAVTEWVPPAVKPKAPQPRGTRVVTGLASIV